MITSFARIIKYGLQNFVRNGWLSVATSAIMIMTLLVVLGLVFFDAISKAAIDSVKDKIDIGVYFRADVSEDIILEFERELEALPQIKEVEYISQDQALELFKERHNEDETVSQALEELNFNPLLGSLVVRAFDPNDYAAIDQEVRVLEERFLADLDLAPDGGDGEEVSDEEDGEVIAATESVTLIDNITFAQNQLVIERLTKIINTLQNAGLAVTLVLIVIVILITFNTIRLAIYSNREELSVMRLVGAANSFINGPYLVTGILYGVVAAVVSLILVIPVIKLANPHIQGLIPEFNLNAYFETHLLGLLLIQLAVGAVLGALSSSIAIRKYLKL